MIQQLANVWAYAKRGFQWLAVWGVVTVFILGSIASYTWAKTAWSGYEWAFEVMKAEK